MRLHHLEVTAFGPFPGTESLDLDELGDAGLFLLTGSTGAGKTSLLDAICFALFGRVPGDRQDAKRLRSDHAAPDARPRVLLELTLSGRRFRLTRSPEWQRPKRRGTGTTPQQASVVLDELTAAGWTTLSTRIDETQHLLESMLGMDVTQFTQVAMLPQGRFEAFLRAGAGQRQALLERLFGTVRFRDVEQWLVERRKETGRAHDGYVRRARSLLDAMHGVVGLPPHVADADPRGWTSTDGTAWTDVADALCVGLAAEVAAGQAEADRCRRALAEAERTLAESRAHADASARAAQAHAVLIGLEAEAELARTRRDQLAAAERAREVTPLLAPLLAAEQAEAAASAVAGEAGTRAGDALARVQPDLTTTESAPSDLDAWLRLLERRLDRLEAVAAEAGRASDCAAELSTIERLREDALRERAALQAVSARLPATIEALGAEVAAAEQAAAGLDRLAADVATTTRVRDAARQLQQAAATVQARADARRDAVDAHQRARDELHEVQRRRLAGAAASLALGLVPGRPCAVCGAREHPAPATSGEPVPHESHEIRSRAVVAEREAARLAAESSLRAAEVRVAGLAERAGGLSPDDAEEALVRQQAVLADATNAAGQLDELRARLTAATAEQAAAVERSATLDRSLAGLGARAGERTAELERLHRQLRAAVGGDLDLAGHRRRTLDALEAVRAATRAAREHERAARVLADVTGAAAAAAAAHGFADVDQVRAAAMSVAERDQVHGWLAAREQAEQEALHTLTDPVVAALAASPPPAGPATAAAEVGLRAAAHDEAVGALAAAVQGEQRLLGLRADLLALLGEGEPVRRRYETVAALAALAEGKSRDNSWQMSLSAYVLTARLEQVVAAANERLDPMTGGRYTLEHTVARAARDRRGGLGLLVRDGWTGQSRDPRTLSGGETFQASLALALGLADVVGQETGGAEMHTLFVDEGFGSLDPDTLDEVMDVLDGLRAGGRVVGLVSHVALLRERVPAQVRVDKHRTGSVVTRP